MVRVRSLILFLVAATLLIASAAQARDLTFEERVKAQEAIERVYYSHQIGTTKPFEDAVSRAILEAKVIDYLKQSAALEWFWRTPVTAEMLQAEMERQARQTRMPERLRALYAALGDDPLLVRECLARPVLVDRLARGFFAFDERFHAQPRAEARELHQALLRHGVGAFTTDPRRRDSEIVQVATEKTDVDARQIKLTPEEFTRWRKRLPERPRQIGAFDEERDGFVVSVVVDERPGWARVASFRVEKTSWDEWWRVVSPNLDVGSVRDTHTDGELPILLSADRKQLGLAAQVDDRRSSTSAVSSCVPDDTWDNGSLDDVPGKRYLHTAVWTGTAMIIWGGWDAAALETGARYDPATDTWTPTSTVNAPAERREHAAVWAGDRMIVWGGYDGSTFLNSGSTYDPVGDSWTAVSLANAPTGRTRPGTVWTGTEMIVWGGQGPTSPVGTGGRYDPSKDTWTPTSNDGAPSPRRLHTTVWTGSVMIIWGGYYPSGSGQLSSGGRYDPVANSWLPTSTSGEPQARNNHTAVWTGTRMIVWGGDIHNGITVKTGAQYDPVANTWSPTATTGAPSQRQNHVAVWTGNEMVVWGGNGYPNTGGRYYPETNTWSATSTTNAPSGRNQLPAVWTGSLMLVWGGYNGQVLDTGGRYDPSVDVWSPTSSHNAPSPRTRHTSIWTGNLMIVWGGTGPSSSYFSTGGRYDPALDSWTPTSSLGAPSPRDRHTAVWTSTRMIVWGGYDGAVRLNTGGRYDPMSDTWATTSTDNAPPVREQHTAVWTGTRMIVWGGSNGSTPLNTGGRYDPSLDEWNPTQVTGSPQGRLYHIAVWAGDRMVVWGGQIASGSSVNNGGRYDPIADTWLPTSLASTPSSRSFAATAWTGDRMVVWGGEGPGAGQYPTTGGRYNPVNDTWLATNIAGAPEGRRNATAVWTSNVIVYWGGYRGTYVNTGGRYDPIADTWLATTLAQAPGKRDGHRALWAGGHMLVWGGYDGTTYLSSGGRYALGHSIDGDADGYSECTGDCNDGNAAVHPGVVEICDGFDNDCDSATGDGTGEAWLGQSCDGSDTDLCAEGAYACVSGTQSCGDTTTDNLDVCDVVDNDCDGSVDESADLDLDGDGWTVCAGDCDDSADAVHPGASDCLDGVENNCLGSDGEDEGGRVTGIVAFHGKGASGIPIVNAAKARVFLCPPNVDPEDAAPSCQEQGVGPAGAFEFPCVPGGPYKLWARIEWDTAVVTTDGEQPHTWHIRLSKSIQVEQGDLAGPVGLIFSAPVVFVPGFHEGSCLTSVDDAPFTCDPDNCSGKSEYFTTAVNSFLESGFMSFVAAGLLPCEAIFFSCENGAQCAAGTACTDGSACISRCLDDWAPSSDYSTCAVVSGSHGDLHEENGERLAEFLSTVEQAIHSLTGDKDVPVDIVAHSMGGITTRATIGKHPEWAALIRQVVMLGTPNAGSVNAEGDKAYAGRILFGKRGAYNLTRSKLRQFNNKYGDPVNANGVPFHYVAGSGGPDSGDKAYRRGSKLEPNPNDGIVGCQSMVEFDVSNSPPGHHGNERFREDWSCDPLFVQQNCLIRIPAETYLCTTDDHTQLKQNAVTLAAVRGLLTEDDHIYTYLRCDTAAHSCNVATAPMGVEGNSVPAESLITRGSAGSVLPSAFVQHEHVIDSSSESTFLLEWNGGTMTFWLEDPLGTTINPTVAASDPNIEYFAGEGLFTAQAQDYTIQDPISGVWKLNVLAGSEVDPTGENYSVKSTSQHDVRVAGALSQDPVEFGASVDIFATVTEAESPLPGGTVEASMVDRFGVETTIPCLDDGVAPDALAGDGVFSGTYGPLDTAGFHAVSLQATGQRMDGMSFERMANIDIIVNSNGAQLEGTYSESTTDLEPDGFHDSLEVGIGVTVAHAGLYSLEGHLVDGIGSVVDHRKIEPQELGAGPAELTLTFGGSAIRNHQQDGPYLLTGLVLRRSDANNVICDTADNAYFTAAYGWAEFEIDDPDADGIERGVDNCPFTTNPAQDDGDTDGVGDACDNCPANANSDQTDTDIDGFGDTCDACPAVADAFQSDVDMDGQGDGCDTDSDNDGAPNESDCSVLDPLVWSFPPDATDLVFNDKIALSWSAQAVGDSTVVSYDVVKGNLGLLRAESGIFSAVLCLSAHQSSTSAADQAQPGPAEAFYYLVRTRSGCTAGDYGSGTSGPRAILCCP